MYIFFSFKTKKNCHLDMNPHTQNFLCGRITWKVGMSMVFLDGCASLHFFIECAPASPSCIFPEEIFWSALALPFCIPSTFIAFSFLMSFAQCSISDMFQHMNHDDFATVAGVVVLPNSLFLFYVEFFSHTHLICWCGIPLYTVFMKGVFKCL